MRRYILHIYVNLLVLGHLLMGCMVFGVGGDCLIILLKNIIKLGYSSALSPVNKLPLTKIILAGIPICNIPNNGRCG